MPRNITFITALLFAPLVQAGDYFGAHFLIVGAVLSTIPVEEMTDVAAPEFRDTIQTLSKEWSDKCGVRVDVWHTNLMFNETNEWTPDYWFAYIAAEETEAAAYSQAPATGCISESYVKFGEMSVPSLYMICAQPETYPEIYEQSCN